MGISSSDFDRMERRLRKQRGRGNTDIEDRPVRRGPSEAQENARIAVNRATPEAQDEHDFRLASWADENGDGRCLLCGARETLDADDNTLPCVGLASKGDTLSDDRAEGPPEAPQAADDPAPDAEGGAPDGGDPERERDGERAPARALDGERAAVADQVPGEAVHAAAEPGDADHAGDRPGGQVSVTAPYTEGVMHAHLGAGQHFHEVSKIATETGAVADARGFELALQHKHETVDGVLKMSAPAPITPPTVVSSQAVPMPKPAPEPEPKETKKSLSQLLGLLVPQQPIGEYRVVSKSEGPTAEEHRTTLGIVYPVGREDAHGDKMTSDEVRKAAWGWAKKGFSASGTQHQTGTGGAGVILESYLWPDSAPDWHVKRADGTEEVVKSGDWLAVVQWDAPTWSDIRKGKYTGYSLQGMGKRVPEDAAP